MIFNQTTPLTPSSSARGTRRASRRPLRAVVVIGTAMALASCVASEKALLTNGKPMVGQQFTAQLFRHFSEGKARDIRKATFHWNGEAYARDAGTTLARFVAEPLEGNDYILQGSDPDSKLFEYWIGRKLTDGAYLIFPLDEAYARRENKFCASARPIDFCILETKEQLVALAHATANKPVKDAEIAVLTDEGRVAMPDVPVR